MVTFYSHRHPAGSLTFFGHPDMNGLFQWALGYASSGGTVIGEALAIASRIRDGDPERWVAGWARLADRVETLAAEALTKNERATARAAYLRAANYWRCGEHLIAPDDPRLLPTYKRVRTCFQTAASLLDPPIEYMEIPFAGGMLPGYFQPAAAAGRPRPTLLMLGGSDVLAEELYFWAGAAAAERGYNAAFVDLPGQGGALRLHGLTAQPASEHAVGAVLDVLLACPEVDPRRLAVHGTGDGGYHAARAAVHDPRVTALIANPAITDLHRHRNRSAGRQRTVRPGRRDPPRAAAVVGRRTHPHSELLHLTRRFTIHDWVEKVSCPTLCLVGDATHPEVQAQTHDFHDRLLIPKALRRFTDADGATTASQVDNLPLQHQVVFDWLKEHWHLRPFTTETMRWPSLTPPDLYLG